MSDIQENDLQTKLRRQHEFNKIKLSPTVQKLSRIAQDSKDENEEVTVRVPSAGGGFTYTTIPLPYLKEYLAKHDQIYYDPELGNISREYTVLDPKVIDKAKTDTSLELDIEKTIRELHKNIQNPYRG